MKKKFAAAFVSGLIAIGVVVTSIDDAAEEVSQKDSTIVLVGVVAKKDLEKTRKEMANLFCTTTEEVDPSKDKDYFDCIEAQKEMFSRGLSRSGIEPSTHFVASWKFGINQFDIFNAIRKSKDIRVVLSTTNHPCVESETCEELGLHSETFESTLRRMDMKTTNGKS